MGESKPEQAELERRFFEALYAFGERERELVEAVVPERVAAMGRVFESRRESSERHLRSIALGFLVHRLVASLGADATRDTLTLLIDLAVAYEKRGQAPPLQPV